MKILNDLEIGTFMTFFYFFLFTGIYVFQLSSIHFWDLGDFRSFKIIFSPSGNPVRADTHTHTHTHVYEVQWNYFMLKSFKNSNQYVKISTWFSANSNNFLISSVWRNIVLWKGSNLRTPQTLKFWVNFFSFFVCLAF